MKNLNIDLETAKQKFDESPEWLKLEMLKTFGNDFNKRYNYTDIKRFEDVCKVLNITDESIDYFKYLPKHTLAYEKICIIIKAINGVEWNADYSDPNQPKFYNWYIYSGSGLRFSITNSFYDHTFTNIGARLCFETKEKAEYFAENFIDLVNDYLN
jgi:hypothetical protein